MKRTCKECLSYGACLVFCTETVLRNHGICEHFKDRSRFVELPCKVGDTVYAVRRCSCHRPDDTPWKACVGKVALKSNKGIARACLYVSPTKFKAEHLSQIGKTVFLTREEAEAELARRTANG